MRGRFFFIASAVSLLSPFLCGCYLTGTMWKEAGATRMGSPEIVGVIRPGAGDAPGGGVVVRYELDTEWRAQQYPFVFLKVPLHGTSLADSPFCINARGRTRSEILAGAGDGRREGFRVAQLVLAGSPGQTPRHMKGFLASDPRRPEGDLWSGGQSPEAALTVLAFRPRPDGSLEVLRGGSDQHLPDCSLAAIVASEATRPQEDAAAAKMRAALLTPLTPPADVVVTPVIFGAYLLHGGG